jgi:hypothetical protein
MHTHIHNIKAFKDYSKYLAKSFFIPLMVKNCYKYKNVGNNNA